MDGQQLMIPIEEYNDLLDAKEAWYTTLNQMNALLDNVRGASEYVQKTKQPAEIMRLNGMTGGVNLCLDILRKNMEKVCR